MLFLYRPRQTWMPFALPQSRTQQAAYNRRLQDEFESTRTGRASRSRSRRARSAGTICSGWEISTSSGVLTDAEFEAVKARLLAR